MTPRPPRAVDTSVAVPLLSAAHEAHGAVSAWADGRSLSLGGHALAETFAVLTRLPGDARVSQQDAVALINDNFPDRFALPAVLANDIHDVLARANIAGGATYDALVALAARERKLILATRDGRARGTYESVGAEVELVPSSTCG